MVDGVISKEASWNLIGDPIQYSVVQTPPNKLSPTMHYTEGLVKKV